MGNNFSSALGGVSKVFPIGTFVLARKLNDDEIEAASSDSYSAKWTTEMDKTVGQIGIVVGGGTKPDHDIATVFFMIPSESVLGESVLGDYFNYQSSWLEKVEEGDLAEATRDGLRDLMRGQMRKLLVHAMKNRCPRVSNFGAVGTLVRVMSAAAAPSTWPFHMAPTLNRYGIVIGGRGTTTTVVFPEPIYYFYTYDADELTHVHTQSLDDLTLVPEECNSLTVLRKIVLEAAALVPEQKSDSDDEPEQTSDSDDEMQLRQQVAALKLRVAALESEVRELKAEKKDASI